MVAVRCFVSEIYGHDYIVIGVSFHAVHGSATTFEAWSGLNTDVPAHQNKFWQAEEIIVT